MPQQRAFAATEAAGIQRQTGGGSTDYGEVSLDGGGGGAEVALDGPAVGAPRAAATARSEDDMEFGAVPQEAAPGSSAPARIGGAQAKLAAQKPRRRIGLQLLVGAFVLGLGGAALALVPAVGPFGAFFIMDRLNAGDYHAQVGSTAKSANAALAEDTYPNAARAGHIVANAQLNAPRAKGLAALAAYVGFVSELRFGTDAPTHARASVLVDELAEETDVDMLDLARAARAAADGQIAKARQLLGSAESSGKTLESSLLRAELELRAKDANAALAAWEAAKRYGDTPRLQYGLARAKLAAGDDAGARAAAEAVLAKHPQHVGARVLVARLSAGSREDEARALALLEGVVKDGKNASADELVQAYTLLGSVHLGRSRISAAESAFSEALKINPKASRALVGLGDSLYRAGRYSEAQARFEAGAAADPDDLLAKVGVAKAKLSLERIQEASALLKKLREAQPTSSLVGYWYGRVQEALGARDEAQAAYREVLKAAPADPDSADVYIASALLFNQQGRPEDAQKTLDAAKQLMPTAPGVWRALGDVAQAQGRYKEALRDFQHAAELDPEDLGAKFRIGSALRRDGQFEAAIKAFDAVAAVDKDYPGLALERGLLYEASGHSEEALKQYEDALAKAPTDPDLMLRVGCGKVAANRAEQAEELLKKVLSQRPTSAETSHCLGRALLVQGTRLADALRTLERAVELDPNRAEYHLYVGWAANEAGNVPKAEKALAEALRLDQGLADAYWQRGVLRQRQGAVRDAISDLTKALALRPSRHEAHASLADAFYDLGREQEALKEWQLAIQAQRDNPTWRFRYGKLLSANHQTEGAVEQLTRALALIDAVEPPPRWRWEAHHTLARALGPNPEAAKHWEQFLRLGPRDSPYRPEAKAFLDKAGRPWTGE
jgi:tetratricopeptide (TPR) repeat protein